MRDRDRSFLADLLVNPREHSYDLAGMHALVEASGLRFVEWRHPGAWRLRNYVDDLALVEEAEALGARAEAELVYELAGLASPHLDLLLERDDAPERPPYSDDELLAMRMIPHAGERQLELDEGRVVRERVLPPYERREGHVIGPASSGHGAGRQWAVHDETFPFVEAFDGERTVAEVCDAFAALAPRAQLLDVVRALSPADAGLLAPIAE